MKKPRSRPPRAKANHAIAFPELEDEVSLTNLRTRTGLLSRMWRWLQARKVARSSTKRLRVAETVSLGEKRFVAVVQVDGRHFLLAGGPTNIALLAQLTADVNFEEVLKKTMTVPGKRRAKRKRAADIALQRVPAHVAEPSQKKSNPMPRKQPKKRVTSEGSANAPVAGQLNEAKAFSAVLKEVMATPKQTRRQNTKQETKQEAGQDTKQDFRQDTTETSNWPTSPNGDYA
jgi:flagellar biogenesis protein FliO